MHVNGHTRHIELGRLNCGHVCLRLLTSRNAFDFVDLPLYQAPLFVVLRLCVCLLEVGDDLVRHRPENGLRLTGGLDLAIEHQNIVADLDRALRAMDDLGCNKPRHVTLSCQRAQLHKVRCLASSRSPANAPTALNGARLDCLLNGADHETLRGSRLKLASDETLDQFLSSLG